MEDRDKRQQIVYTAECEKLRSIIGLLRRRQKRRKRNCSSTADSNELGEGFENGLEENERKLRI
jgi:hypothetical protein